MNSVLDMKLSCGFIIINSKNQILGCKPHGKYHNFVDIPKGCIDEGETPYQCAIRETREETGLDMRYTNFIDCGEFDYMINKRLHIFKCYFDLTEEDLTKLKCVSTYFNKHFGQNCPEVCKYELINFEDIESRFYLKLGPIIKTLI